MSDYTLGPCGLLATGRTRSGKTSFIIRYLLNAVCACRFVFDFDGQVSYRLGIRSAKTASELEDALDDRWVVFDPRRMFPDDLQSAFEFFCDWVFNASCRGPGRKMFVVDEVWKYCTPNSIPKELARISQTGRVEDIELILATQLPHRINASLTQGITEVVSFALEGHLGLNFLRDEFMMPAEDIRTLEAGHFVARNTLSGAVLRGKLW